MGALIRAKALAAAWALIACGGAAALGQASQPASQPGPAPGLMPYVNATYGFEVQLPAGWTYDRGGFPGPSGATGVLRGAAPGGRATLQVLIFRDPRAAGFARWLEVFGQRLGAVAGTTKVALSANERSARPEAVVTADATVGGERTVTFYYCVEFDPATVWVFSLAAVVGATDESDRAAARGLFEQLTGTLRIHYSAEEARRLMDAVVQGLEFQKAQLESYAGRINPDENEYTYEIALAGRPIGYMTRRFTREQQAIVDRLGQDRRDGLRVRERTWRFLDDGSAVLLRMDLFSTQDLRGDLIEVEQARVPARPSPADPVTATLDQAIREGDVLFLSRSRTVDAGLPEPRRPLALDPAYLGLAWVRLLPGLLGAKAGPPRAFVIYDADTRGLTTHQIEPLGRRPLPGGGGAEALAFRTREGFIAQPATLYADDRGILLRLEAGDVLVTRSDAGSIEEKFGQRRDQAAAAIRAAQAAEPQAGRGERAGSRDQRAAPPPRPAPGERKP